MSEWPSTRVLIASAMGLLADAITAERNRVAQGEGVRGAVYWGPVFLYHEPLPLAVATLCSIFGMFYRAQDGGYKPAPMSATISGIGESIMHEMHFTVLRKEAPRLKRVMENRIKNWNRRNLRAAMKRLDTPLADVWPAKQRRIVGQKLLSLAIQHAGIVESFLVTSQRNTTQCLRLTGAAWDAISENNARMEILYPMYPMMLVPPADWDEGEIGGYRMLKPYTSFVRGTDTSPPTVDDHSDTVYAAVNSLQRTPWRINQPVLDTMAAVWKAGGGWADVPAVYNEEPPEPYPEDRPEAEQLKWKAESARRHSRNNQAVSKRLSFMACLETAEEYQGRMFYYPHNCDFRGRSFHSPETRQTNGSHVQRGLRTFVDGKTLGERSI